MPNKECDTIPLFEPPKLQISIEGLLTIEKCIELLKDVNSELNKKIKEQDKLNNEIPF